METKQRMAITGVGLVAAGIGLSALGAALILPVVVALSATVMGKGAKRLNTEFDRASRTMGTVAGTLQRSFTEAAKAGIAESRRSRANVIDEAV